MYFMSVEIVLFYFIVRLYRKNNATIVQCAPACPQGCRKLGVEGGNAFPSQILTDQLTLFYRGGGGVMPTVLLLEYTRPPRIFRPSYGPASPLSIPFLC